MKLRDVTKTAIIMTLFVACGETNQPTESIVITTDKGQFAVTTDQLNAELPAISVDATALKNPRDLLHADSIEFQLNRETISVLKTEDGLEIRTSDGLQAQVRFEWFEGELQLDGAMIQVENEDAAGLLLFEAIKGQISVAEQILDMKSGDVRRGHPATYCQYICYEFFFGSGVYICRHYPRGMYYDFEVVWYSFPCYAGGGRLNFICEALPWFLYATCSGSGA